MTPKMKIALAGLLVIIIVLAVVFWPGKVRSFNNEYIVATLVPASADLTTVSTDAHE